MLLSYFLKLAVSQRVKKLYVCKAIQEETMENQKCYHILWKMLAKIMDNARWFFIYNSVVCGVVWFGVCGVEERECEYRKR